MSGTGEMSFPSLIPFLRLDPAPLLLPVKIQWKCNHTQLGSGREWTHAHTRIHRHMNYTIPPLQGSHAENCFGHGDEGVWGVVRRGSFLIYIFNVKYYSKRES